MSLATNEAPPSKDRAENAVNAALVHRGPAADAPEQSRGARRTSFEPADFPVPTGREEEWRFTPLDRLRGLLDEPHVVTGAEADVVAIRGDDAVRVELIGRDEARALASAGAPGDRAAVLADAASEQVRLVRIPAQAQLGGPVVIEHEGLGDAEPTAGHTLLLAEQFATGTVVLRYRGRAARTDRVEVVARDGAHLTVVTLHEWDDESVHLGEHAVLVGRDATVRHISATLGGRVVRQSTNATYAGPGGTFEALGVYFADDGQHLEHRLFVDHAVPRCTSNVVYKGALQGASAHTVWIGDVLIRAGAQGTDTYELNRNLILTDGARADSVPNLEIETGEIVGAGHASATGRFDDEQLFYLMARGIPESEARRLVVRAFFAEIVHRIGLPEISERLMAIIEAELTTSMGAPTYDIAQDAEVTA